MVDTIGEVFTTAFVSDSNAQGLSWTCLPDIFSYGAVEQNSVLGHDCHMLPEGLLGDALQVLAIKLYASS